MFVGHYSYWTVFNREYSYCLLLFVFVAVEGTCPYQSDATSTFMRAYAGEGIEHTSVLLLFAALSICEKQLKLNSQC